MEKDSRGLKIGVVFGGRSTEHKVSVVSARTVAAALLEAGYEVVPLAIAQDGCWVQQGVGRAALDGEIDEIAPLGQPVKQSLRVLLEADFDVSFPIVHGTWGEDGTLQGLFEMLDIPYVGTDVASSAVCMDKLLCKRALISVGLPVVDFEAVSRRQLQSQQAAVLEGLERLGLPLFIKPAIGGSSVGVRKVSSRDEILQALEYALRFDDNAVVEISIEGRELECAVLGYGEIEASGIGEIVPGNDFYDYADKYIEDGAQLIHEAALEPEIEKNLRQLAIEAFASVGGSGMARVDFLLDESGPKINEINTLPGFTSISMYPKLWQVAGLETAELVSRLVEIARRRHSDGLRLDNSIRSLIESLGQ